MAEAVAAISSIAPPTTPAAGTGGDSVDSAIDKAQGTEVKAKPPKYGKYGEPLRGDDPKPEPKKELSTAEKPIVTDDKKEVAEDPEGKGREKYVIDGKDIWLDKDTARQLIQKSGAANKRLYQLSEEKKQVSAMAEKAEAALARAEQIFELLSTDPVRALKMVHGDDDGKIRQSIEPYLADRIREELEDEKNPHNKLLRDEKRARETAEARLAEIEQGKQQEAQQKQHQGLVDHYNKQIIEALELGGMPKNERTAAKMADVMYKAAKRNIEYKPEQVAELVKNDYIEDIGFFAGEIAKQADEAHKAGDMKTLLAVGEQLETILGRSVAMALRRFDLAKLKSGQPNVPRPVVETPKVAQKERQNGGKRHYMSEDEYAAERKRRAQAIDRGEPIADWD